MKLTADQQQLINFMPVDRQYARTVPQRGRNRVPGSERWTEVRGQLRKRGLIERSPHHRLAWRLTEAGQKLHYEYVA